MVFLRASEEKYRLVVENAAEAIFVAQEGMLTFGNPKAAEIIGYSIEELTSSPFQEFIHPDDRERVLDRHLSRLQGEDLPSVYPFRIINRSGKVRWVELNTVFITWEEKPATLNFMSDIVPSWSILMTSSARLVRMGICSTSAQTIRTL